MRRARFALVMCLACSEDAAPVDRNPNLSVEPIVADAGVPKAVAKTRKRVGMGDHRRREDDDLRDNRRRKSRSEPSTTEAPDDGTDDAVANDVRKADEERRHEAERQRMTNTPLETFTNPTGYTAPLQTR
jgi:hypothetical protein